MLGRRMGFMSKNPPEKARILAAAVKELFAMQRDSYYGFGLWKYFPTQTYRKFVHCEETIYKYVGNKLWHASETEFLYFTTVRYSIVSEIVDTTMAHDPVECSDDDVKCVFYKLMQEKDLDIREKKSAIIDFISAGIETVSRWINHQQSSSCSITFSWRIRWHSYCTTPPEIRRFKFK